MSESDLSWFQRSALAGVARFATRYRQRTLYPFIGKLSGRPVTTRAQAAEAIESPVVSLRLLLGPFAFARNVGKFVGYDRVCREILAPFAPERPMDLWKAIPDGRAFFRLYEDGCRWRGIKVHPTIDSRLAPTLYEKARAHPMRGLFGVWGDAVRAKGYVAPLFGELTAVTGIGEKIGAFICRDTVHLAGLEDTLGPEQLQYVQAVDVWVGRAAQVIWSDLELGRTPRRVFRERIAYACHEAGVSGVAFNQGAWILGSRVVGKAAELPRAIHELTVSETR